MSVNFVTVSLVNWKLRPVVERVPHIAHMDIEGPPEHVDEDCCGCLYCDQGAVICNECGHVFCGPPEDREDGIICKVAGFTP